MPIKGKPKGGRKRGQARARTYSAPRPAPVGRRIPWYRSTAVIVTVILVAVTGVGVAAALIANAQSEQEQEEKRSDRLRTFSGEVSALFQTVDPIANQMASIQATEDQSVDDLNEATKSWTKGLDDALLTAGQLRAPTGAENVSTLLSQAIQLYQGAAETFDVAAQIDEDKERALVLERATAQLSQATQLWQAGVFSLDQELTEVGLDPSGILAPGLAPAPLITTSPEPSPSPTAEDGEESPEPTPSVDDEDEDGGRKGRDGKGSDDDDGK